MIKRLEQLPPRSLGLGFLAVFTILTLIAFTGLFRVPFQPDSFEVAADFDSASQLYKGDDVRLDGDKVGVVSKVEPSPNDGLTRVTMDVEKDAGTIYEDARARLRIKTLLAGSFYVQLERGSDAASELGDKVIPIGHTDRQVEIDDVTDIFRDGAVPGFQALPGEVADALEDAQPPADDIATANAIAPDANETLDAVRGQDKGTDLPRLVQSTAKTVAVLDGGNDDLRTVVSGAAATLQTTGGRQAEIRETIDAAPSVTYDMTTTLARLDSTLHIADGLISRLEPAAPELAPALAELRPALVSTRDLLETARPLLSQAVPLLTNLGAVSESGVDLINVVKPALANLDEKVLPYMAREDPDTGKSTTVMIGGTAAGFGGASAQMDENGHFIRFPASVGLSSPSVYVPCRSSLIDPTAPSLVACDTFNDAVNEYLGYLPELNGNLVPPGRKR